MDKLVVPAVMKNLERVTEFVDDKLKGFSCADSVVAQVNVAVDEIFNNIVTYAYALDAAPGEVEILIEIGDNPLQVKLSFVDRGIPYNPLENPDPDVNLSASDRPIGGLGIFLVKNIMDNVSYKYEDGANILTIEKKV